MSFLKCKGLFQGRMLVLHLSRWLCSRVWTGNMINRSCDRLSYPSPENYMIGLESYLGSPISEIFATVASATNTWTHHHSIYKRLQDTQMQNLLNTLSKLHPLYSQNYNWNYEFASILLHSDISLIIRPKWEVAVLEVNVHAGVSKNLICFWTVFEKKGKPKRKLKSTEETLELSHDACRTTGLRRVRRKSPPAHRKLARSLWNR